MSASNLPRNSIDRIVVVGGGAAGLACAFALVERGAPVTVLDAHAAGRGALWASGGMLAPGFECAFELEPAHALAATFADVARTSAAAWPDWAARIERAGGVSVGYERVGSITPVFERGDLERLERGAERARALGFQVEPVQARRAEALEPTLRPPRAALVFDQDGQLDNRALGAALVTAIEAGGGEVRDRAEAVGLDRAAGRVNGVRLAGGETLSAAAVILAVGARSPAWMPAAARMTPVKGHMLAYAAPPTGRPDRVVRSLSVYLAGKPDGRVVVGATSETGVSNLDIDTRAIEALARRAAHVLPGLATTPLQERWAGLRPQSADAMPVLGEAEPGLFLAAGGYRNGVLLAPAMGEAAAEAVLGGASPGWARFSPHRDALKVNVG